MKWSGEQFKCRKCGEVYPYRLSTCSCGGVCDKIADAPQESSSGLTFDCSALADILDDEKQKKQERKQKEREKCENELKQLFSAVKDACRKDDYATAISYLERILEIAPDSTDAQKLLDFCKDMVEEQRREEEEATKHDLSVSSAKAGERKTVIVNGVEFAFRWCPAGTFMMGSPETEQGRYDDEEKQHRVTLTKGFWMMETEVTVGMFKAFVSDSGYVSTGNTPYCYVNGSWKQDSQFSWCNPGFTQDDNHPITCVSWNDAVAFCKWLSRKTGQNITLPTEAQWEYACRAGTTGAYAGNLDEMVWYCNNSNETTHPVGTKKANAWGLYDMHGNVWEWCQDWFGDYPSGSVSDSFGPSNGSRRVIRGGSWSNPASVCRSACRNYYVPGYRVDNIGFRAVRGQ